MNTRSSLMLAVLLAILVVPGTISVAQDQAQQPTMGAHGEMDQQADQPGASGHMMGKHGMKHGQQGKKHGGMGCRGGHGGMGQEGMMQGGMGALFGSRVTPIMNLSVEDVRGYLGAQLDRLNNKRLKVGDVKADDGSIVADIVTVDNSLVQRLKVDRHTGAIQYEN